jgi:hypothetical protein
LWPYLLPKELAKLQKDASDDDALQLKLIKQKQTELNKLNKNLSKLLKNKE